MPRYKVRIERTEYQAYETEVEADGEEEAKQVAQEDARYEVMNADESVTAELLEGEEPEEIDFDDLGLDEVVDRMGWSDDTMQQLKDDFMDERGVYGEFADWLRKKARAEEAECKEGDGGQ